MKKKKDASRHWTTPQKPAGAQSPFAQQNDLVSGHWIVGAICTVILTALLLGYVVLCGLYWQGYWQLLFQPQATVSRQPLSMGLAYTGVELASAVPGQKLTGWFIPAASTRPAPYTVLYLHGGSGNMGTALPELAALHATGVDIFAFDYRGFGASSFLHPSEQSILQDAASAYAWLGSIRHLEPSSIVLYGTGVGAVAAAQLAISNPSVHGLILSQPSPPAMQTLLRDQRTHRVPASLLVHDRLDLAPVVASSSVPKLFLSPGSTAYGFTQAALPKRLEQLSSQEQFSSQEQQPGSDKLSSRLQTAFRPHTDQPTDLWTDTRYHAVILRFLDTAAK